MNIETLTNEKLNELGFQLFKEKEIFIQRLRQTEQNLNLVLQESQKREIAKQTGQLEKVKEKKQKKEVKNG